ncbi:MAG: hypothetical protein VW665_11495 [Candidatus Puniceispirillum sp.]
MRIGFIHAVKGVIIGQLLIFIVGFDALFELDSANVLMKPFWLVLLVLFALAISNCRIIGLSGAPGSLLCSESFRIAVMAMIF